MRRTELIRIYRKLAGIFLVTLFCGYFGSITLFPHTHIVDGITVVHSHPYKSLPANTPANHSHSKNGFLLIQLISSIIATALILCSGVVIALRPLCKRLFNQNKTTIPSHYLLGVNRARAPTA